MLSSAAMRPCHSRVSTGSSVVPIKATFAFLMMPRTVRSGSVLSFSLQKFQASSAFSTVRGLLYPKNCLSSRLHQ